MKKIIGIDASLTGTGVAVLVDGKHYEYLIKTSPEKFPEPLYRIKHIATRVLSVCTTDGGVEGADWGIEGYAFMRRAGQLTALAECAGLIKQYLYARTRKPPIIIAPTTLKKFVTGSGQGKKNLMLLAAYKKWGVEFESDDTADAFGIAKMVEAILYRDRDDLFKYEQECVKTIKKSHKWVK